MEPLYETAELSSNHYTESHGHFVKAEGWKRRQKQRMVRERKKKKKKGLRELRTERGMTLIFPNTVTQI